MGHIHRSSQSVNKKRLLAAIWISFGMMLVELAGGMWTNSLALLSDAFHMFTHIFALAVSYVAIRIVEKPASSKQSFGYHRAETIAALINGIFLIFITIVIFFEAGKRFFSTFEIAEFEMLLIASAGLIVNLVTAAVLMKADRHNLNIRGAFLHMIGDAASSVGIIVAGIIIYFTKWYYLDPIISIVIALVIVYWAFGLLRDSVRVLMQSTPRHIDVKDVKHELIMNINGIHDIHDIHIWELTRNHYIFSAHIITENLQISETETMRNRMSEILNERYHINHVNFQFETVSGGNCVCDFEI